MNILIRSILIACLVTLGLGWFSNAAIAQTATTDPICYMQTQSGTLIDLRSLCQQQIPEGTPRFQPSQSPASGQSPLPASTHPQSKKYPNYEGPVSYPDPPNVYDYKAMEDFDRELYGD